ncbi:hypothetical protein ACFORH_25740 [Amycolatopsis roodepoortensis]|uniref:Serine/threonine protein kinase n=1 Tax=Amycolatopsis roodepoortensis TaxID=700274 RepID=A0ABR9LJV2_9PSEU|nr:hypothetical protein [Amycolatopsis roodepoortensis]MBE1580955.1 hypothetical protein [Amycolatopsis roodepoortensis]
MSWQDELRQLDVELASGRIGHTEHRKRRDELLAEASGGAMPSPVASPLRHPAGPWHSTNPAARPAELPTVTLPPVPPPAALPEQQTQAFDTRPREPEQPAAEPHDSPKGRRSLPFLPDHKTTAPSPADINPTVYLRAEPPQPRRDPGTRQLPRNLPSLAPDNAVPRHRAPALEDYAVVGKKKPTWLFIAAGVLVVLGLIIGGTVWLGAPKGGDQQSPPAIAQAPDALGGPGAAQPTPEPALEDRVPALPGSPLPENSTVSLDKGVELKLLQKESAQVFAQHGVTSVVVRGSSDGDTGYLTYAVPTRSAEDAKAVVTYMMQAFQAGGFAPRAGDPEVVTGRDGARRMDATWYTSGNVAVGLLASQPFELDKNKLRTSLDKTRATFKEALPPS